MALHTDRKGEINESLLYDVNYIPFMLLLKEDNIAERKEGDALWRAL